MKTASLEVLREAPMGLILGDADREVLLPARYVAEGPSIADVVEAFVHIDSEGRPIATSKVDLRLTPSGKEAIVEACEILIVAPKASSIR